MIDTCMVCTTLYYGTSAFSGRASWRAAQSILGRNTFVNIKQALLNQYREFVAALRFLTVLPAPGSALLFESDETAPFVIGCEYFPLVGLLLAALLWLLVLLFSRVPGLALTALLVVALVILTGGLHLDGLMDSCDGLFGGATRERKLEIMRDSRVGSFGVLGALGIIVATGPAARAPPGALVDGAGSTRLPARAPDRFRRGLPSRYHNAPDADNRTRRPYHRPDLRAFHRPHRLDDRYYRGPVDRPVHHKKHRRRHRR